MAFSSTTDNRPHTFGDMIVLHGTYNCASVVTGAIDLSAHLSELLMVTLNNDTLADIGGSGTTGDFALITAAAPTSITFDTISGSTGKWMAIGRR